MSIAGTYSYCGCVSVYACVDLSCLISLIYMPTVLLFGLSLLCTLEKRAAILGGLRTEPGRLLLSGA